MYSYSYRDRDASGQTDHIYAPPDDGGYDGGYDGDYGDDSDDAYEQGSPYGAAAPDLADTVRPGDPLGDPEVAEDGVVDADFRVIIPPPPPVDPVEVDPGSPPAGAGPRDEWDEADDALTP